MARFFLRSEWPQIEEVLWGALEAGALDAAPGVAALDAAFPGGPQTVALAQHPQRSRARGRARRRRRGGPPGGARRRAVRREPRAPGSKSLRERLERNPP